MAGRGGILDSLEVLATLGSFVPNPWVKAFSILSGIVISSVPVKRPQATLGQSYGWDASANKTPAAGTPLPVIYGKTRVKPVLKNRYIKMDGDKQWLYVLYSFAGHGVDRRTVSPWAAGTAYSVGDEVRAADSQLVKWPWWYGKTFICTHAHTSHDVTLSGTPAKSPLFTDSKTMSWQFWKVGHGDAAITEIEVNGNAITSFDTNMVDWETKSGTAVQGMVEGFDVTYQNNYEGLTLKPFIGEWGSNRDHWIQPGEIVFRVDNAYECILASLDDAPPDVVHWVDLGKLPTDRGKMQDFPTGYFTTASISVEEGTQLYVDIYFPKGLYGIRTSSGGSKQVSNTVGIGLWYKKTTETWGQSKKAYYEVLTKQTNTSFHWTYAWDVAEGAYDVRVGYDCMHGATPSNLYVYEYSAELFNVASLVYANFTYPGEPLLGIKLLATAKLQGDVEVTAVCQRSKVWVRDGGSSYPSHLGWSQLDADNHAWAVYDLLVQGSTTHPSYNPSDMLEAMPRYGCGISYTRLDYTSFKAWADLVDSLKSGLGYKLNIVFDNYLSLWEAIGVICFEGRGVVMPYGAKYYAIPDKAESPVHLLCEGNITAGSLTQAWGDKTRRANTLEITYKDADRETVDGEHHYADVSFIVRTASWAANQELTDPARQTLYGTTDFDQAYSIAKYFLNCNETLMRTVNLALDVEGMNLAAGDVVYLQHTAMGLGVGGRIVAYTEYGATPPRSSITLDRSVTLAAGVTYGMVVRNDAGVIEVHTDTVGTGTVSTIYFSTLWANKPEVYSPYAFGVDGAYVGLFRVVDARRNGDMRRNITLLEYDAAVYDIGDIPDVTVKTPTGASKPAPPAFNEAANIRLSEFVSRRPTGEYQSNIRVAWDPTDLGAWGEWEVLVRDITAGDPSWKGEWVEGEYGRGDKVTHDGKAYISLTDNNTGTPYSV